MLCCKLHELFNSLPRIFYPFDIEQLPYNGIYIMFEKGERYRGMDRIVRIGSHTGQNNLRSRLKEHFINENADRSIFRKNIGRAILSQRQDPYLEIWELDFTSSQVREQYSHIRDMQYEMKVEGEVSQYIRNNISFVSFCINDKQERLRYEAGIIAALTQDTNFGPSIGWFGRHSPIVKIRESGLWLTQHLSGQPLSNSEFLLLTKITGYTQK